MKGITAQPHQLEDFASRFLDEIRKNAKPVAWRVPVGEYAGWIKYNLNEDGIDEPLCPHPAPDLQAKIESLLQQLELAHKEIDNVIYFRDEAYRMLAECQKDSEEQARLLGMSGSREAKLLAELATAKESAEYAWKNTNTVEAARQDEMRKRDAAEAGLATLRKLAQASLDARDSEARAARSLENAQANFHLFDAEERALEKAMIEASEADRALRDALASPNARYFRADV